jgi:ABC-type glycerol-3-phosphate transport system substrate-binding protein
VVVPICCGTDDDIIDEATLTANYSDGALGFGTVNDTVYGLLAKANSKSTFWYKPASFADLGVTPPDTWDELLAIVDAYVAAGKTPLSIGGLDGWTLTDWFENIYIRVAGPEAYDQLFVTGEVKWTDATVVEAMERFQEIISPTSDKLAGGAAGSLSTGFIDAFDVVLNDDAEMYYEGGFMGSFAAQNFPDLVGGEDYAFFPFPEIDPQYGKPVVGGGDLAAVFNDTPEVRELLKFLASPEANTVWASADKGAVISPNSQVSLDVYENPLTRLEAEAVLTASIFVFDGSDLADPAVGGDAMFTGLQEFIDDPDDIDGVLEFIESVAAGVR